MPIIFPLFSSWRQICGPSNPSWIYRKSPISMSAIYGNKVATLCLCNKVAKSLNTTVGSSRWISASNSNRCHFDSPRISNISAWNYAFATTLLRSLNTTNRAIHSGFPIMESNSESSNSDITSQRSLALKQKLQSSNTTVPLVESNRQLYENSIGRFILMGDIFIMKSNLQPSNTSISSIHNVFPLYNKIAIFEHYYSSNQVISTQNFNHVTYSQIPIPEISIVEFYKLQISLQFTMCSLCTPKLRSSNSTVISIHRIVSWKFPFHCTTNSTLPVIASNLQLSSASIAWIRINVYEHYTCAVK